MSRYYYNWHQYVVPLLWSLNAGNANSRIVTATAIDITGETQDKVPAEATHRMAGLRQLRFPGSTKQNTHAVPGPLFAWTDRR